MFLLSNGWGIRCSGWAGLFDEARCASKSRRLNALVRQYHIRLSTLRTFTHLPQPLRCFTVRFLLPGPIHKALTKKSISREQ
jgi:hypothetical protein